MVRIKQSDDQELLSLIKQSDYQAFDELYNRYWKKLYITAFRKTGCKEDAMDLVQDLFVEFWNKRESITITSSLGSYLVTSLYYKTFHHFRTKGLKDRHTRNFQEFLPESNRLEYSVDPASPHEIELEYEQQQKIINRTIEEMPERMRQVFQMTHTDERSVAEIAAILNISPQTVKNQTANAMQRLKKVANELAFGLSKGMLLTLLF